MEEGLTEKIDIMVSTKSRDINDFLLIKKFSLGDNLGYLVLEGVDLSAFEGQEIYIAIVCRSEKMQGAIWLQNTFVTSKLPSPELIKFELLDYSLYDKKINMEWSQVTNAKNYYINIDMVVDTIVTDTKFMIKDDFNYSGNTNIESGKIHSKESDRIKKNVVYKNK